MWRVLVAVVVVLDGLDHYRLGDKLDRIDDAPLYRGNRDRHGHFQGLRWLTVQPVAYLLERAHVAVASPVEQRTAHGFQPFPPFAVHWVKLDLTR